MSSLKWRYKIKKKTFKILYTKIFEFLASFSNRVMSCSTRLVNISSQTRGRVKLEVESSSHESSFDRDLTESNPSSSRVISSH